MMILGLAGVLAFGVAFGVEFWRQPVETETDVLKATGLRVLGSVGVMENPMPANRKRPDGKPILLPAPLAGTPAPQNRPIHVELYRAILANIETERLKSPFHSILVTSPGPSEGKSTTILNLAHALQEFGLRVLIVEADLRRPSLSVPLALTSRSGIVDFLVGTITFEQACRRLPSGVTVIPGQVARGNPLSLLASARCKELLHVASSQFDLILVDSAPVLAVPDNILFGGIVDRVLLVAKATGTSKRDLRKAQEIVERAGGRLLGVVLNQANPHDVPYYSPRYRKYYGPANGKGLQEPSRRFVSPPETDGKTLGRSRASRDPVREAELP
jgi:capsular exopolysaccharide synthesis family protein